jgi:hypothetical protein
LIELLIGGLDRTGHQISFGLIHQYAGLRQAFQCCRIAARLDPVDRDRSRYQVLDELGLLAGRRRVGWNPALSSGKSRNNQQQRRKNWQTGPEQF